MSHLRAKFQQTSGQRLTTNHHFPAQFQNSLARRAGTAGDHPMSKKCFNPVCVARPGLLLPVAPPPPSPSLSLAWGVQKQILSQLPERTGIFCRSSVVSAAALPLHLPSKAEHLGHGRFSSLMFTSDPSPLLARGSQVALNHLLSPGDGNALVPWHEGAEGPSRGHKMPRPRRKRGNIWSGATEKLSRTTYNFRFFPQGRIRRTNRMASGRHMARGAAATVAETLRGSAVSSCTHENSVSIYHCHEVSPVIVDINTALLRCVVMP